MSKKDAIALLDEFADLSEQLEQRSANLSPWREDPLPLAEFMEQHLGLPLWPKQREDFEMFLGATAEDTKRLFTQNPPTPYNCGALVWGKGSGKDLSSSAAMVWFVHVLLCMRNPQEFLELEQTEAIDIAIASPTLRQTRRITFTKFKNRLKDWAWLHDLLPELGIKNPQSYLKRATEAADYVELPHKIRIHNLPLDSSSSEGFNLLAFILSEFAGLESEALAEGADKLFNTFVSSGKTRFRKAWKGFIASFPRSSADPQEKLIEAKEAGLFPELYVVRRPTWEVHPDRTFEDFATDFARDPEGSWAKYGAQPRAAVESYFRSPELIIRNASGGHFDLFQKQFGDASRRQIQRMCDRTPDPIIERDLIDDPVLDDRGFPQLASWFKGKEGVPYYAHIDVGLRRDSCGIAMGHLDEIDGMALPVLDIQFRWKASHFGNFGQIKRHNWHGSEPYFDLVEAAEIDLTTVTHFCIWLKRFRNFGLEHVTCDGFNSAQLMQTLQQYDIPAFLHTVDKTDFDELKGAIYQRHVRYRCDRILYHELAKLEIKNGKVDAPRTKTSEGGATDSHKDVADAVAAVARRLIYFGLQGFELFELSENVVEAESEEPQAPQDGLQGVQQEIWEQFFS